MSELLFSYDWSAFERVVVLSPHLDDAALSCGGLLTQLRGMVSRLVVTVCCSRPPQDAKGRSRIRKGHAPPRERRREDIDAMHSIDCDFVHLGFSDAVFRRSPTSGELIYPRPRQHLAAPPVDDAAHVEELYVVLRRLVNDMGPLLLISPLGLGQHVDHFLTAQVALRLASRRTKLLFYEDFPYSLGPDWLAPIQDDPKSAIERLGRSPGKRLSQPFDVDAKALLMSHYGSQVPVLFGGEPRMRELMRQTNGEGPPAEIYWTTRARQVRAGLPSNPTKGALRA